jgi:hypothetical protein
MREGQCFGWDAAEVFRSSSGSLVILAAMRRASSRVSKRAAERRPGFSSKMGVGERLPVELAAQPSPC